MARKNQDTKVEETTATEAPEAKQKKSFQASTGLPRSNSQRYHYDIYALLEGPQEIYFGHEVAVNVNLVETVKIAVDGREIEKCYLSPTKRRGIERRMLINFDVNGILLGDKLGCGIPHTCGKVDCPICRVYGALIPKEMTVDLGNGTTENRSAITFIGRLTHGGGVAVQEQDPSEKQRAMHPSSLHKDPGADPTPIPFKREYNEPGLLYPVYNHALSVSDEEFSAVAYAFLQSIARIGAGNPKGVKFYEGEIFKGKIEPMIVVDRYLAPMGSRPIVSPQITTIAEAVEQFSRLARTVKGRERTEASVKEGDFDRWIGTAAHVQLQEWSQKFVTNVLNRKQE